MYEIESATVDSGFIINTAADMENLPEPSWLFKDTIPSGGLGVVVAAPGAGKSFLMLEIANAIARQRGLFNNPTLMPLTPDHANPWVLVILPESAPSWGLRIKTSRHYMEEEISDNLFFIIQPPNMADPDDMSSLMATIAAKVEERGEPPVATFIDTFSSAIPGADENNQAIISTFTANLQDIVNMGTTVIVTHHFAKYSTTYRGSSVILGSVDWMIGIDVDDSGDRTLRKIKLRDAEDITPLVFYIEGHDRSAVIKERAGGGAWAKFDAVCEKNNGLRDAWLAVSLTHPDGTWHHGPGMQDIVNSGTTLGHLVGLWNEIAPMPIDRVKRVKANSARRRVVIKQAAMMIQAGIFECDDVLSTSGTKVAQSLTYKIRQVIP